MMYPIGGLQLFSPLLNNFNVRMFTSLIFGFPSFAIHNFALEAPRMIRGPTEVSSGLQCDRNPLELLICPTDIANNQQQQSNNFKITFNKFWIDSEWLQKKATFFSSSAQRLCSVFGAGLGFRSL